MSGGKRTAPEGLETLQKMRAVSLEVQGRPIIMPGGGLNAKNIGLLHEQLQAAEYHFGSAVRIKRDFKNGICGEAIQGIMRLVNE